MTGVKKTIVNDDELVIIRLYSTLMLRISAFRLLLMSLISGKEPKNQHLLPRQKRRQNIFKIAIKIFKKVGDS